MSPSVWEDSFWNNETHVLMFYIEEIKGSDESDESDSDCSNVRTQSTRIVRTRLKNGKLPTSGRWQWRKRKITSKPNTLRNWHKYTYTIYCNKAIPGDKPSFVSMTLASREGVVCCV